MSLNGDGQFDIELFPCAGGWAEGFRRAGITFDMMIEINEEHCDSYEANLGHRPTQMDARSFLQMLQMGWRPPHPVRMISGDPPCVSWSRAGKRLGLNDPRDMIEGTCRIIELLQPEIFIIGNVPGLDDGPNLHIVQRTIGALSKHGYCTADFQRLDAANYGVPQHRHRPFWYGHKRGPCIQWPAPTHGDPDELKDQMTIPGVAALIPWVTCKQALGHLSLEELGRPIKLRRRNQNSKQHGSVDERPARTVGTSNLSDGNVLLPPDAPRAGKRGKPNKKGQGDRIGDMDAPSATVTRNGGQAGRGAHSQFALTEAVPSSGKGPRARDRDRVPQSQRHNDPDKPSVTVTAKAARKGAGAHSVIPAFTIQDRRGGKEGLNTLDAPSHAALRNTHGNGSILVLNDKHRPPSADEPANTLRGGGEGHSAPNVVIENLKHPSAQPNEPSPAIGAKPRQGQYLAGDLHPNATDTLSWSNNHPPSFSDEPAMTQRATSGGGAVRAMSWPWDRPSTTVLADERLGPPGHHDERYAILNTDGDGIVISEKAAAILQGFPDVATCKCGRTIIEFPWMPEIREGDICSVCGGTYEISMWQFHGETKKTRWSQLGQAVPAPLAHAVAISVVRQIEKTKTEIEEDALRVRAKSLANGYTR